MRRESLTAVITELEEYVKNHCIPAEVQPGAFAVSHPPAYADKGAEYTKKDAENIGELISSMGETFREMLFRKIDESRMTDAQVYRKANLDRRLFSKIRSNPAYHTRKNTVLALAIALKLSLEDTEILLEKAGYALSPASKGDLIVRYFIERQIYDIEVINYALYEFGQSVLGGTSKPR